MSFEAMFTKTYVSSNPRLSGGAHTKRGKRVKSNKEGAKQVYSSCLSAHLGTNVCLAQQEAETTSI